MPNHWTEENIESYFDIPGIQYESDTNIYEGTEPGATATEIDWGNLTDENLAQISQDPNSIMEYIMRIMDKGGYFSSQGGMTGGGLEYEYQSPIEATYDISGSIIDEGTSAQHKSIRFSDFKEAFSGIDITGKTIGELESIFGNYAKDKWGGEGNIPSAIKNVLADLQEEAKTFKESGYEDLSGDLDFLKSKITGGGGLFDKIGGARYDIDDLLKRIDEERASGRTFTSNLEKQLREATGAYVPQEKQSRYGRATGTSMGGVDPTQSYLSNVRGTESDYYGNISNMLGNISGYESAIGTEGGPGGLYGDIGGYYQDITNILEGPDSYGDSIAGTYADWSSDIRGIGEDFGGGGYGLKDLFWEDRPTYGG